MAFKIGFGQYIAADSPVHKLDPRTKLICSLAFMIAAFSVKTPSQLIFAAFACGALLMASKVPARAVMRSMQPVLVVLALLGLFNLFFVQTGPALLLVGPMRITTDGLWAAVLYVTRFAVAIVAGTLIMLTTTPTALSDAFDVLLSPLSRVGLPGHEVAMVLSLMLRFIPTLADDATAISEAQRARGASLSSGSLRRRAHATKALLISLLASALRHANNLSRALDARCYAGDAARTHLHPLRFTYRDAAATITLCAYVVVLTMLR